MMTSNESPSSVKEAVALLDALLSNLEHVRDGLRGAYSDPDQALLEVERLVDSAEASLRGLRALKVEPDQAAAYMAAGAVIEDLVNVIAELSQALEQRDVEQTRIVSQALDSRHQRLADISRTLAAE